MTADDGKPGDGQPRAAADRFGNAPGELQPRVGEHEDGGAGHRPAATTKPTGASAVGPRGRWPRRRGTRHDRRPVSVPSSKLAHGVGYALRDAAHVSGDPFVVDGASHVHTISSSVVPPHTTSRTDIAGMPEVAVARWPLRSRERRASGGATAIELTDGPPPSMFTSVRKPPATASTGPVTIHPGTARPRRTGGVRCDPGPSPPAAREVGTRAPGRRRT